MFRVEFIPAKAEYVMKTIFIYSASFLDGLPRFFIMDGDFSHLDGVYIDCCEINTPIEKELFNILFDDEDGDINIQVSLLSDFPHYIYDKELKLGNNPKVARVGAVLDKYDI